MDFEKQTLAADLRAAGFRAGEPAFLSMLGFRKATVLAAGEANERYFRDRTDGFRLYGSRRMMAARV